MNDYYDIVTGPFRVRALKYFKAPIEDSASWDINATVVPSRYQGTYEYSKWLAFPCDPGELEYLADDWNGDDISCANFWDEARRYDWIIGHGANPSDAYYDLRERLLAKAFKDNKIS